MDASLNVRSLTCSAHLRLQAKVVAQAGGMPPEFPASPCSAHLRLLAKVIAQADGMPREFPASPLARPQKETVRAHLIRCRELSKDQ
jgi:hypothetical protein